MFSPMTVSAHQNSFSFFTLKKKINDPFASSVGRSVHSKCILNTTTTTTAKARQIDASGGYCERPAHWPNAPCFVLFCFFLYKLNSLGVTLSCTSLMWIFPYDRWSDWRLGIFVFLFPRTFQSLCKTWGELAKERQHSNGGEDHFILMAIKVNWKVVNQQFRHDFLVQTFLVAPLFFYYLFIFFFLFQSDLMTGRFLLFVCHEWLCISMQGVFFF